MAPAPSAGASGMPEVAEWVPAQFDPAPPVGRVLLGTPSGDGAVLAQMTEPGDGVVSWTLVEAVFRSAAAAVSGGSQINLRDMVAFDGSLHAMSAELDFEGRPASWRLWSSLDGVAWAASEPGGLDRAVELWSISATAQGLFLGGVRDSEANAPGIWHSPDGTNWQLLDTPPHSEAGGVVDVIATDTGLVAFVSGQGAIWQSVDGGATWTVAEVAVTEVDQWSIESAARLGAQLVAVGGTNGASSELLVVVSGDGGATWRRVTVEPTANLTDRPTPNVVVAAADAFWVTTWHDGPGSVMADPAACYQDLHSCRSHPVLLRSDDGLVWSDIDLGFAGRNGQWYVERAIDVGSEGLLILGTSGRPQHEGWIWASVTAPPRRAPVDVIPTDQYPLVGHTDSVAIGATYRYPMSIHCGIGNALGNFDGRYWVFTDAPSGLPPTAGVGDLPAHWPIAEGEEHLLGLVTRTDEDTIEYRLPSGELVATYTASDEQPPGCA